DRIVELQFAAQEVLDDPAPEIFRFTHDRGDSATVQELARFRVAADMEAPHHRGHALGDELQAKVAPARILVRLHAGQTDQQLDAVFGRLLFDRVDRLGADHTVADFVP